MLTWDELEKHIRKMTPTQRRLPVAIFDYNDGPGGSFKDPQICLEGLPEFHLVIDDSVLTPAEVNGEDDPYYDDPNET